MLNNTLACNSMKILNFVALISIVVSITTLSGIISPSLALEKPMVNDQIGLAIEPSSASNLTSNWGSNISNATAPPEYSRQANYL